MGLDLPIGLTLLVFGWLVLTLAVTGLIAWVLIAFLAPMREQFPDLARDLGRLSGQWIGLGVLSLMLGLLSGPGFTP